MKPRIVTEKALRELVLELLDDPTSGAIYAPDSKGVKVNPVVDPSAAETDPMNPSFKPQNSVELGVAMRQLTQDMPDEQASRVYDQVKTALDAQNKAMKDEDEEKEDDDMKKDDATTGTKSGTHSGTTAEAMVRNQVRKILREEYEAYDAVVGAQDDDDEVVPAAPADDVDNDKSFDDIAQELGMSVAGAKQFVDKAMARLKFLGGQESRSLKAKQSGGDDVTTFEPPQANLEDLDVLLLKAWNDYVNLLNTSGELTPADVQLMHDHPEVALELQGFREFVHEYVQASTLPTDAQGDRWLGKLPDDVDPELKPANPNKPDAKRSGKRTFQNAPAYSGDFDWLEDDDEYKKVRRKAVGRAVGSQGPAQGE